MGQRHVVLGSSQAIYLRATDMVRLAAATVDGTHRVPADKLLADELELVNNAVKRPPSVSQGANEGNDRSRSTGWAIPSAPPGHCSNTRQASGAFRWQVSQRAV